MNCQSKWHPTDLANPPSPALTSGFRIYRPSATKSGRPFGAIYVSLSLSSALWTTPWPQIPYPRDPLTLWPPDPRPWHDMIVWWVSRSYVIWRGGAGTRPLRWWIVLVADSSGNVTATIGNKDAGDGESEKPVAPKRKSIDDLSGSSAPKKLAPGGAQDKNNFVGRSFGRKRILHSRDMTCFQNKSTKCPLWSAQHFLPFLSHELWGLFKQLASQFKSRNFKNLSHPFFALLWKGFQRLIAWYTGENTPFLQWMLDALFLAISCRLASIEGLLRWEARWARRHARCTHHPRRPDSWHRWPARINASHEFLFSSFKFVFFFFFDQSELFWICRLRQEIWRKNSLTDKTCFCRFQSSSFCTTSGNETKEQLFLTHTHTGHTYSLDKKGNVRNRGSMSDRDVLVFRKRVAVYGVFDGHGGSRASKYAAENIHKNLVQRFPKGRIKQASIVLSFRSCHWEIYVAEK